VTIDRRVKVPKTRVLAEEASMELQATVTRRAGLTASLGQPFRYESFVLQVSVLGTWLTAYIVMCAADVNFVKGPDHDVQVFLWAVTGGLLFVTCARYFYLTRPMPQADHSDESDGSSVYATLAEECVAMSRYAIERGMTPDQASLDTVVKLQDWMRNTGGTGSKARSEAESGAESEARSKTRPEAELLRSAHKSLCGLVAPALPRTVVATLRQPSGRLDRVVAEAFEPVRPDLSWLGNVRLVRMMLALAMVLIPLFVALALAVGTDLNTQDGIFHGSFFSRLQAGSYLVVTSALGASFSALFKVKRYLDNMTYDDRYEPSYWTRWVLGLLAGIILAVLLTNLLPFDSTSPDVDSPGTENAAFQLTVPLLALVGGFSSDLVYRLLKRVIDAIEALMEGSAADRIEAATRDAEARSKNQAIADAAFVRQRTLANVQKEIESLLKLRDSVPDTADNQAAREQIQTRMQELLTSLAADPSGG
jgi:hypothetical protein